ncbi:hypothetical protein [Mucilaginibacter conchicola]|nr:hypothetical protein [Mucilaginibacter conchicola]
MRIQPEKIEKEEQYDEFADLTPTQQRTRKASIILAFVGVFVWAAKILFF